MSWWVVVLAFLAGVGLTVAFAVAVWKEFWRGLLKK